MPSDPGCSNLLRVQIARHGRHLPRQLLLADHPVAVGVPVPVVLRVLTPVVRGRTRCRSPQRRCRTGGRCPDRPVVVALVRPGPSLRSPPRRCCGPTRTDPRRALSRQRCEGRSSARSPIRLRSRSHLYRWCTSRRSWRRRRSRRPLPVARQRRPGPRRRPPRCLLRWVEAGVGDEDGDGDCHRRRRRKIGRAHV